MNDQIPPDQEILYSFPSVKIIAGNRSRAWIYDGIAKGTFPRPVQLGPQSVAWRKSEIDRWIAARPTADPTRIIPPSRHAKAGSR